MRDQDIPQMRQDLAEFVAEDLDHGEIIDLLIEGSEGYVNWDDEEVRKAWKRVFK